MKALKGLEIFGIQKQTGQTKAQQSKKSFFFGNLLSSFMFTRPTSLSVPGSRFSVIPSKKSNQKQEQVAIRPKPASVSSQKSFTKLLNPNSIEISTKNQKNEGLSEGSKKVILSNIFAALNPTQPQVSNPLKSSELGSIQVKIKAGKPVVQIQAISAASKEKIQNFLTQVGRQANKHNISLPEIVVHIAEKSKADSKTSVTGTKKVSQKTVPVKVDQKILQNNPGQTSTKNSIPASAKQVTEQITPAGVKPDPIAMQKKQVTLPRNTNRKSVSETVLTKTNPAVEQKALSSKNIPDLKTETNQTKVVPIKNTLGQKKNIPSDLKPDMTSEMHINSEKNVLKKESEQSISDQTNVGSTKNTRGQKKSIPPDPKLVKTSPKPLNSEMNVLKKEARQAIPLTNKKDASFENRPSKSISNVQNTEMLKTKAPNVQASKVQNSQMSAEIVQNTVANSNEINKTVSRPKAKSERFSPKNTSKPAYETGHPISDKLSQPRSETVKIANNQIQNVQPKNDQVQNIQTDQSGPVKEAKNENQPEIRGQAPARTNLEIPIAKQQINQPLDQKTRIVARKIEKGTIVVEKSPQPDTQQQNETENLRKNHSTRHDKLMHETPKSAGQTTTETQAQTTESKINKSDVQNLTHQAQIEVKQTELSQKLAPLTSRIQEIIEKLNARPLKQSRGNTSFKIANSPAGEIEIIVNEQSSIKKLKVLVQTDAARQELQKVLPQIQQNLLNKGVEFASFSVDLVNVNSRNGSATQNQKNADRTKTKQTEEVQDEHEEPAVGRRNFGYNTIELVA